MKSSAANLRQRLKRVRCLLVDVDGVLTDGRLHLCDDGREFKSFDVHDGHGIAMAQKAGLLVGFISSRPSAATECRAKQLGVRILKQAPCPKAELMAEVCKEHGLQPAEIAYIGDELLDLSAMKRAGCAMAVADAAPEVKKAAHYVTRHQGGQGAVREVVELILKARGDWKKLLAAHLLLLALCAAGCSKPPAPAAASPHESSGYIENFEIPERDEHGLLRRRILGQRARILPDGSLETENIRVEFYSSNKLVMVFSSPRCLVDRSRQRAQTDAPVRVESDEMLITGIGGNWDGTRAEVNIHSNTQMVLWRGGWMQ